MPAKRMKSSRSAKKRGSSDETLQADFRTGGYIGGAIGVVIVLATGFGKQPGGSVMGSAANGAFIAAACAGGGAVLYALVMKIVRR
jgi:hypothetical protein